MLNPGLIRTASRLGWSTYWRNCSASDFDAAVWNWRSLQLVQQLWLSNLPRVSKNKLAVLACFSQGNDEAGDFWVSQIFWDQPILTVLGGPGHLCEPGEPAVWQRLPGQVRIYDSCVARLQIRWIMVRGTHSVRFLQCRNLSPSFIHLVGSNSQSLLGKVLQWTPFESGSRHRRSGLCLSSSPPNATVEAGCTRRQRRPFQRRDRAEGFVQQKNPGTPEIEMTCVKCVIQRHPYILLLSVLVRVPKSLDTEFQLL